MENDHKIQIAFILCSLMIGAILFVMAIKSSDAVPVEYRSASPGFNWGWEFDYDVGMKNVGRFGGEPRPWPAKLTDDNMLLPLNQPLLYEGLEITYQGMSASDRFRLTIAIHNLDANVAYPLSYSVVEAKRGFMVADRQFQLEKISDVYLRLRSISQ